MKYIYLLLIFFSIPVNSQQITKDIFNDYVYCSEDKKFCSALKKDIFGNIIYSDDHKNTITYEKKYISKYFPEVFKNENVTRNFFEDQMAQYSEEFKYEKKFVIDMFDKEMISDNRNNTTKIETDIFGHFLYEETFNGEKTKIFQNSRGDWEFQRGNQTATLEKDFRENYVYKDSKKSRVEYNGVAFSRLMKQFGGEKEVFIFLFQTMLLDY